MKESASQVEDIENFSHFAFHTLHAHNEYRRRHRVPDLILSEELCEYAQEWADFCAETSTFEHRKGCPCPYGENLYTVYSSNLNYRPSPRDAVKYWYDEIKQFIFGVERIQKDTLRFTQIVWKASRELGVGVAKNKKGDTYVVANYFPKGNCKGQFVKNVPSPSGTKANQPAKASWKKMCPCCW